MIRQIPHRHFVPLGKVNAIVSFRGIPRKLNNSVSQLGDVLSNWLLERVKPILDQQEEHRPQLGGTANTEHRVLVDLVDPEGSIDGIGSVGQGEQCTRVIFVEDLQGYRV